MAALFHDINFKSPEHAQIETLAELNAARASLGELDYRYVLNHPLECAGFVRGIPEIPPDVDMIVLQHHERPDGSGFPAGLKAHQIAPLAAVMIVAHDILNSLTDEPAKFDLAKFLEKMDGEYQGIAFRKVWRCLGRSLPGFAQFPSEDLSKL
jgi:HD-GYP domain-containing protein (c-di-GMP phosphodiesterase class II)